MSETKDTTSRRAFLRDSGRMAGVSTLAGMTLPYVHAAENNTIQLALVGCGGRGTGATENALGIKNGPIKLVAMADVFPQKLSDSHGRLRGRFASRVCPGGKFTQTLGGTSGARPDGVHFSPPAARWLADWLGPKLVATGTNR